MVHDLYTKPPRLVQSALTQTGALPVNHAMSTLDVHSVTDQASSNFFNQSDDLAVIFKGLVFTVKMKEKIEDQEPDSAATTPTEETPIEGAAPASRKRKKKKFWQKAKTRTIEKDILRDLTGIFRPGRLTAVMGASGAGKTTLLSVLAGNVEGGVIKGQIQVNGEDFTEVGKMQKISGFVFQDDILLPTMKVKEAIEMSALLRLPKDVPEEERHRRVNDIIRLLHLKKAAKTKVGDPRSKGISGGERKRTSTMLTIDNAV